MIKKTQEVQAHLDLVVGAVKLGHALNLGEGDRVTVLKAVPDLIQGRDKPALRLLRDAGDHGGDGLLAVDVADHELGAEVVENLGVKAGGVRDDEGNVVLPGINFTIHQLSVKF